MSSKFFLISNLIICLKLVNSLANSTNLTTIPKDYKNAIILNFAYHNELPIINVNIGSPHQEVNLVLNTAIFHTTVSHHKCNICTNNSKLFNPAISSTFKLEEEKKFNYLNSEMEGHIFFDKIYLHNKTDHIDYFGLGMISKYHNLSSIDFSGYLGLSRNYVNNGGNTFSIVDMLYQDKFIIRKSFRFNFANSNSSNMLVIGNVFNQYDNVTSNYTGCFSNHRYDNKFDYLKDKYLTDFWNCNLSYIYFHNLSETNMSEKIFLDNSFEVNYFAVFSTAEKGIRAPIKYANLFKEFLQKYLNSTCSLEISKINVTEISKLYVICEKDLLQNFNQSVSLVFNGYAYLMQNKFLFKNVSNNNKIAKYELAINFDENLNFFVVGLVFLKNFDVIFSKDINEVGFLNGQKLNFTNFTIDLLDDEISSFSFKYYFGNFLIIILVVFLIIWYIRRNRRKKELNQSYQAMMSNY